MVSTLRALGAECDWLIPDRIGDGYGVSAANVEKLAKRGTKLMITVDCGVTAVEEVRLARELGIETIVTDHHQAGDELPDCPILHPEISNYPFVSLCGTAVAWKLACALREASGMGSQARLARSPGRPRPTPLTTDLDLVALATVADVVPLVGENRSLVKRGLVEMRRARRVGLRALMAAAKCEPTRLDEGDLAFRLAPRINAAGRLYRADAGVELMLTEDEARAEEIAAELGRANSERRAREREVDTAAEAARRELPEHLREAPGLVLAGEDWHPGVVGIVASRLVERHHRPVVVVSLDGEGGGRGSGPQHPRLRPARGARGLLASTWRASAAIAPPPGSRCGPRTWMRSARPSRRTRPRSWARGAAADPADRRDGRRRRPRPRAGRGAGPAGALRDGQPGRAADGSLGAGQRRAHDGGGQARALQPPQRLPPRPRRRLRPLQPRRRGRRPGRRRGPARGQPLERLGRAPRRPQRALSAGGGRRGDRSAAARLRVRRGGVVAALRGRAAPATSASPTGAGRICRAMRGKRAQAGAGGSFAAAARPRWRSPSWSPAAPACSRSAPTPRAAPPWPGAPPAWPASTAAPPGSPARAAAARRWRAPRRAPAAASP